MTAEPPHPARRQLYADMAPHHLTPLWEVLHALVPPQPRTLCVPAIWHYETLRPFLRRAGEVIDAEEAVRRVLILENPALPGQSAVTQSLYAGLQLILPGELAPSHRHTQSALRFVVEGQGAYTAVEGERTTMKPGDFIITPSWAWHDHGNDSTQPVVWLDGLDIPMLRFFDAGFAENGLAASQSVARAEGTNFARHGHNLAPVRGNAPFGATSPLFCYPYERTREALQTLARQAALDPWEGFKLRYTNPSTGGSPMPTLSTFMQLLPAGFAGKAWRQTDGAVFSVVEGQGHVELEHANGRWRFEFGPQDHFVVPSWHTARLFAQADSVLFSFSDRVVHQALGIHREERLA